MTTASTPTTVTSATSYAAAGKKATSTTTTQTEEEAKTSAALTGLGDNFNQFLKLLTTQMQNQDPLKPMDTNEMTNQLVQFANVEQNIATNSKLDKMLKLQESYASTGNLYYLNKWVEYPADSFQYINGMDSIDLGYELERSAEKVRIDVMDDAGRTIRSVAGETGAGTKHIFSWDFKDDNGIAVQPGTYKINIAPEAKNVDDPIKATTYVWGAVTSVDVTDANDPVLKVNAKSDVPVSKVVSVQ